jgi:hypothetical protein
MDESINQIIAKECSGRRETLIERLADEAMARIAPLLKQLIEYINRLKLEARDEIPLVVSLPGCALKEHYGAWAVARLSAFMPEIYKENNRRENS